MPVSKTNPDSSRDRGHVARRSSKNEAHQNTKAQSALSIERRLRPARRIKTNGIMKTETSSWIDSVSASGKDALQTVEAGMGTIGEETRKLFHHLPGHATLLGGALGLGAATLVGVAELATAVFSAYVSYRVFAYGESLTEAFENAIKFEGGKLSKKQIEKRIPK